ncbi:MAG: response regulator transcription factor, partial [Firmicutes bacterium]|nr:response regulator transcription factor [Candidatus Colimorpha enterica]
MYKILVVDDEKMIRELIKKRALFEGHSVTECADGAEAVRLCREKSFDVVILDIMMPVLDGISALKLIREFSDVPVMILSAMGEEYHRINGFRIGADDYIVKPFSASELMLRIDSVVKRYNSPKRDEKKENVFVSEGMKVDFDARIVTIDGQRAEMTPKEYDLLFYLIKNKNIALKRERLISEIWGYDYYG